MRSLAVIIAFVLTFPAVAQYRQARTSDSKAIERIVENAMRAWQLPGAAVAVVRNDRLIYAGGFGKTEAGGMVDVTPETAFQLASTSKAFTTTALAMLATEGKLSFDDPVSKHVDYFRLDDECASANVTVRDIVSHRTGLSRHDELWDNSPWSREDVLRMIGKVELSKPFRTSYQYQNIMFIAAGEVVAAASGMSWDDYVKTKIFEPLGMKQTFIDDARWERSHHAVGHRFDWRTGSMRTHKSYDTKTLGAAGAIKSTALDMAQWIRFHLANGAIDLTQLVDPQLLDETKTPHTVIRVEGFSRDANPESNLMAYGMGWVIQDYRDELLVSHAGALNGFRAHVDLLPKRNAGFVVMTNVGRGLALIALRNSLADYLSGKNGRDWNAYYLMVERNADEKDEREKEERLAKRVAGTSPSLPIETYAGEYRSDAYGVATITIEGGQPVLAWSLMRVPLAHFNYDVFRAEIPDEYIDEEVTFEVADGKVRGMKIFGQTFVKK